MTQGALPDLTYAEGEDTRRARFRTPLWKLFSGYWSSDEKWVSGLLVVFILTVSFCNVYVAVWNNQWTGRFYDAIGAARFAQLPPLLGTFLGIVMVSTTATIASVVAESVLDLRWRTWLTRDLVSRWTSSGAYFRIERDKLLDNADQRISEDVKQFVDSTLRMTLGLIRVPVSAFTFSVVLWNLTGSYALSAGDSRITIPGYMVLTVFAYSGLTLLLTHLLGRSLIPINIRQQKVEADFRALMLQIREGSEQVAFYDGAGVEASRLRRAFGAIRANTWHVIRVTGQTMFGVQVPGQVSSILPVLLVLPQLMSGTMALGGLMRVKEAFNSVSSTLSFFPQIYQSFATWRAVVRRLLSLMDTFEPESPSVKLDVVARPDGDDGIHVGALVLSAPNGNVLAHIGAFSVNKGARCLVRGRSGAGKSTLLRALAGIWPYGEGRIVTPPRDAMMFVPQKSYVPVGSLKQALAYPGGEDTMSTEDAREVLVACGLDHYVANLDEVDRWAARLSGGEQQRLAFARVLLRKPGYIFLDEATSALDEAFEHRMYALLTERLPDSTIVSVAHRKEVALFHDQFVDLTPPTPGVDTPGRLAPDSPDAPSHQQITREWKSHEPLGTSMI